MKKDKQTDENLINVEETLSKAEKFVEENKQILIYIVSAILLIVAVIWGYNKFIKQPKEQAAYENMFMAEYYFEIDSLNLALNGDGSHMGFLEILDNYKWTAAGNLARYYIGMIYMRQGKYKEAIEHLKHFKSKDEFAITMANGAIGDAYVELNDLDAAAKYYLRAAEKRENNFTTPVFLKKAAWVYEQQKKYDKAIELYKRIKKDYPRSQESREAEKFISYLENLNNNK